MPYQNPRRPSRPIPQAPNLMNTIPPGVPGINAPIPPQMPIPPTPDLMNTLPPGIPGIDPRVPLANPNGYRGGVPDPTRYYGPIPIPPTPDLMNTIPPGTPGIPPVVPDQYAAPFPSDLYGVDMAPPPAPGGGGFQKPTYGTTHGARAPISNAPRQGGLLSRIIGNMRANRQTRRGR